jgi:periplasmic divalent cation tolerance protein
MKTIWIIYIPTPSIDVADKLSNLLLSQRLVACANMIDAKSMYMWNGAMAKDDEVILICKTMLNKIEKIEALVTANHPYELPAIVRWTVECNKAYHDWVVEMVS